MLDWVLDSPATLAAGRLLRLDGPAGSGKTTLADAVAAEAARRGVGCRVVHLDSAYDGWEGLPRVGEQLHTLLGPLAQGRTGHYRHYDWAEGRFTHTVEVEPVELLVLEGVGAGLAAHDAVSTLLVWVEAPTALRRRRAVERDGEVFASLWDRWASDEAALFARERTRERADLVVDGARGVPDGPRP